MAYDHAEVMLGAIRLLASSDNQIDHPNKGAAMDITLNADDEFDLTLDRGDDEAGTLTLEIVTDDGKVTINLGRFYDDLATTVGELKRCADKGEKMLADWEDRPDEYDAFVTEDRAAYYLKLEGTTSRNPRSGYPTRDVAEYELAAWMAESGVFPNAWFMNERGNVENISESIRKYHDLGGDKLLPLEGVQFEPGADIHAPYGGASVVKDYGNLGIQYIYHGDDTVHFNEDRESINVDEEGGITPEALADGHKYVMGNVNAYCPKCTEQQGVTVLTCEFDTDA